LQAGSGFLSQHSKEMHFGVGAGGEPVQVTVKWPSGATQQFANVPVNHKVIITEGQMQFETAAHRPSRVGQQQATSQQASRPPQTDFGTWLIEPMPALPFALPDLDGHTRSLDQFAGKPLLLLAVAPECEISREQLIAFQKEIRPFQRQSVSLAALSLPGTSDEIRAFAHRAGIQFPVLLADQNTAGTYEILYRYLFDRRRDLEPPVSFLIDKAGSIVKVYQGPVAPASVLRDVAEIPQSPEERLRRAVGPVGQYYGDWPRRNYFTYGIAFIQAEHVDAALTCFRESVARNPNYASAYYNLGTIYLNKHMLPEARTSLERAVALDPQDADAWTNLGAVAGQQQRYEEALEYLAQAIRVNPTHLVALQNLVMLYRWQGNLEKAQQAIEKAISVQPNDPEFHFALGMLLAGQEHFEEARQELERTVELRRNDAIALNNLGVVYLRLGRSREALGSFERCTQMSPDYDRPYLNIALIYKDAGQQDKAQAVLRSFASRHPENEEVRKALQELGR
jgi:tetratricopeptide (TPR) repeat protein/peroxiredoxin